MALALQVVSSHLLGARDIERALSVQEVLVHHLLPHAASEAETLLWVCLLKEVICVVDEGALRRAQPARLTGKCLPSVRIGMRSLFGRAVSNK
jgi:hypothetical protein